jgi:hypothetical protein
MSEESFVCVSVVSKLDKSIQKMFSGKSIITALLQFNRSHHWFLYKTEIFLSRFLPKNILRKFDFILRKDLVRDILPCTYLAISYAEGQEQQAIDILSEDLRKLQKLYVGQYLKEPSFTKLSTLDIKTGLFDAPKAYVLFCFLFVEYRFLPEYDPESSNIDQVDLFKKVGIKTIAREGSISYSII